MPVAPPGITVSKWLLPVIIRSNLNKARVMSVFGNGLKIKGHSPVSTTTFPSRAEKSFGLIVTRDIFDLASLSCGNGMEVEGLI